MAEKSLNSRIINKHDIEANWVKATNFIPKQGEIIVYDKDDDYSYPRVKIGDGVTNINVLPFIGNDVIEGYYYNNKFYKIKGSSNTYSNEITGNSRKIYIDLNTNNIYRWSGSAYVLISDTLTLGTTSSTAFRGDYGNTAYTHATAKGSAFASGLYKITTNDQGHVTAATAVAKSDITGLGIPAQDTTYSAATTSAAGLMSAADKSKLDGIETGANKTTVDSTLSSTSTNPVQNKVVNTAISALNTLVGDTPVATQITSAINDAGFLTVDLNNVESGTVPATNSDMLGGLPASSYLQVADFSQALTNAGVVKSIASKVPNTSGEVTLIPDDIGAVPASRTVNGKELNNNIFLNYNDVGAAAINFYTLSFPASGWTQESNGTYTQQVSVNGLTANNNGHVDIDMSGATVDTAADIQSAWALVGRAQSINSALLLTCYGSAPEIDLTVKLEVIA